MIDFDTILIYYNLSIVCTSVELSNVSYEHQCCSVRHVLFMSTGLIRYELCIGQILCSDVDLASGALPIGKTIFRLAVVL